MFKLNFVKKEEILPEPEIKREEIKIQRKMSIKCGIMLKTFHYNSKGICEFVEERIEY